MYSVGLLLAAGSSRRFGEDNKLLAAFRGRPLFAHAASSMDGAGLDSLLAVVSNDSQIRKITNFGIVRLDEEHPTQARSLCAGVSAACELGADRILIALADMPFVTSGLLSRIVAKCTDDTPSAASSNGTRAMVPACFPRSYFESLLEITGDVGARSLIAGLPPSALVYERAELLLDINSPLDLHHR